MTDVDVVVIDASALAAIVFGEPAADTVIADIGSGTLVAPGLIEYEIASVCLKKIRRHPAQRTEVLRAFEEFLRLPIQTVPVAFAEVVRLAEDNAISLYDATYLWAARGIGGRLITLDDRLARAYGDQT